MADHPDNAGKKKRQKQTKWWAGDCNDDFIECGNGRQPCAVDVGFSLNDVHRRKLRQRDEPAEGKRTKRVLDAVYRFFPKRFAKPDPEFFYVKPAPACRQKMPELMHDDEQVKEDKNLKQDQEDTRDMQKHGD